MANLTMWLGHILPTMRSAVSRPLAGVVDVGGDKQLC